MEEVEGKEMGEEGRWKGKKREKKDAKGVHILCGCAVGVPILCGCAVGVLCGCVVV